MLLHRDGFASFSVVCASFSYFLRTITLGYAGRKSFRFPLIFPRVRIFLFFDSGLFYKLLYTYTSYYSLIYATFAGIAQTRRAKVTLLSDIPFGKRASRIGEKRRGSRCKARVDILVRIARSGRSFRGDSSFGKERSTTDRYARRI